MENSLWKPKQMFVTPRHFRKEYTNTHMGEYVSRVFVTTVKTVVWLETKWFQSLFRSMQCQVRIREREGGGKYGFKLLLTLNIKVYFVKTFGCDRWFGCLHGWSVGWAGLGWAGLGRNGVAHSPLQKVAKQQIYKIEKFSPSKGFFLFIFFFSSRFHFAVDSIHSVGIQNLS